MDRQQTSPASCVLSHPLSPGQRSSILNQNPSIAESSRSIANDPSLLLKVNKVEFFIRKLQCYWTAVADDLGPVTWAQPTNMYRQIWEQEISAADSKLEHLRDQIRETASSTNPNPNKVPFRFGLRDIGSPSNQNINAHHLPPCLQEGLNAEDRALASHEAQASNKRTRKRKLTRQRAKARRSTRESNPFVYQSLSNSPCPLDTNRRLVTKKRIETVQNQILALRQRLTITSVPNKFRCDPKLKDRLFRFEANDEKENLVHPGSVGFDTATSWKFNKRLSNVDGDKHDEGPGSCTKKDLHAYSGTPARIFGSSFAANIDKYSIAR